MLKASSKTIWIVDDERVFRVPLKLLLKRHGFDAISAFDFADALTQLHQHLNPLPDLAVVDLRLHNEDNEFMGLRILAELRAKGIYAVVLSAYLKDIPEEFTQRPEVRRVVDKHHFLDKEFAEENFIEILSQAIVFSEADRQAEGKLPNQRDHFHRMNCAG